MAISSRENFSSLWSPTARPYKEAAGQAGDMDNETV